MKKIFGFGGRKGQAPSGAAASPRRDSGARPAGYVVRDKDLGKLHQAAWAGDVAKLQRLLLLKKRDLSEPDRESRTTFMITVSGDSTDIVFFFNMMLISLAKIYMDGQLRNMMLSVAFQFIATYLISAHCGMNLISPWYSESAVK
ncbi:ankyrin repeat domain-containing protein 7-like [Macrotis lagotis]|uniref:ankyrin repeat domain-containing protein 7-like n=1 Tax=Macrotis lagotis TaxID=92651 RepID=UPI003D6985F8